MTHERACIHLAAFRHGTHASAAIQTIVWPCRRPTTNQSLGASARALRAIFFAARGAPNAGATAHQVSFDAMIALASIVQLRCWSRCHRAHGNVDGRVRRAPRREHVESHCARTPWPILMVNSAIFRAHRYQDDGMDGALPWGARGSVHTLCE